MYCSIHSFGPFGSENWKTLIKAQARGRIKGVRTLRHEDTSAPVPKCPSDTSAPFTLLRSLYGLQKVGFCTS